MNATQGISPLSIATETLANIRKSVVCSHQILNRFSGLTGLFEKNKESDYQKHGASYIAYLQHFFSLERIRFACEKAVRDLSSSLRFPKAAGAIAITYFGKGESGELSALALKEMAEKISPIQIVLTSPVDSACKHSFFILGEKIGKIKQAVKKTNDVRQFLKKIADVEVVLFDPFLGIVCEMREYEKKGADLQNYIKAWKMTQIERSQIIEPTHVLKELEEEISRVYEAAKDILNDCSFARVAPAAFNMWQDLVKRRLRELIAGEDLRFQEIQWKIPAKGSLIIWAQGTPETMKDLANLLQQKGVESTLAQVKGKSDWVIRIEDPDVRKWSAAAPALVEAKV